TLHWSPGTDIPVATGPERRQEPPSEPWQAPAPPATPEPWSADSQPPARQEPAADRTLIVPNPGAEEQEKPRPKVDDQATLHWSPGTDIPVATGPERRQEPPSEPWQAPAPPATPEPWSAD
ncbi:hypothetical protein DMH08_40060, partial [Actinomadura sp. WAC 06369]